VTAAVRGSSPIGSPPGAPVTLYGAVREGTSDQSSGSS
jgi:hypothetical protein